MDRVSVTKGGRKNKKLAKNRGRPQEDSVPAVIRHIRALAPPTHTPLDSDCYSELAKSLQCPLCLDVLHQPIELTCGAMVCADCCCQWLQHNDKLDCPCCNGHSMNKDGIKSPTPIVLNLLAELPVTCTTCKVATTAREYGQHKCRLQQTSPPLTISDLLATSTSTPTLTVEKQVAGRLVKRILAETEGNIIKVPTKGKVCLHCISVT